MARVTVGIGALSAGGEYFVLASDTRGSYGAATAVLGSHEYIGKQFDFWPKFNLHASVAGNGSPCQSFVSELVERVKNEVPEPRAAQLEHFIREIRETQWHTWEPLVCHELKFQLAITRKEWMSKKRMRTALFLKGKELIRSIQLPVHIIVGGFLGPGRAVFLRMTGTDDVEEEVHFGVIGSGVRAATAHLNWRGQHVHMSLARTLLHVSERLIKAKRNSVYVGDPADYLVATADAAYRFPAQAPLLAEWRKIYRRNSVKLDNDSAAQEEVRKLLYPHISPHAKWSASQM